jgi:inner membrane transporter RhtA
LSRDAVPEGASLAGSAPALATMGAAMVSVQFGASLVKGLFPQVGAQGATTLRVVIAAVILVAVLRPWRRLPARTSWAPLIAYGAALGLMNLTFYAALARIPLGLAVAIEFTGPLAVAVLASRRAVDFLWIALAVGGLLVLLPIGDPRHALDPLGVGLALGAGFFWALYIVFGRRAGEAHGAQATAVGMVVAALVVLPAGVMQAGAGLLAPHVLLVGAGVAVLSSVLPYTCEMYALTRIPVRVFGVLMSLEPALAAAAGWLILHERLTPLQVAAMAAIMIASLGTTFSLRRVRPAMTDLG